MLSLISDSDDTWDPVLAEIFTCLPASFNDVLACVNKRWKNLADSAYWKPDLLLYSWGHKLSAGHQNSDGEDGDSETDFNDFELEANEEAHNWIRAPKMLECFYSPRPSFQIQQVASGDYYTLALSLDGQVCTHRLPSFSLLHQTCVVKSQNRHDTIYSSHSSFKIGLRVGAAATKRCYLEAYSDA